MVSVFSFSHQYIFQHTFMNTGEEAMKPSYLLILFAMFILMAANGASVFAQDQPPASPEAALGTAITYQGRLSDGSGPANGSYDFQFILYNAGSGGAQVGSLLVKENVPVSSGLFTVQLDFGAGVFGAEARWLEVGVRPGASTGTFTILSPRQALIPAPTALYAPKAGSLPWGGLTSVPAGFVDGVDNDQLAALSCSSGQIAKWNGTAWACAADNNTTYAAGTGLALSGGQFSLLAAFRLPQGCATGQIPGWTGSAWACADHPSAWILTGNAGTNPATNYLGTSDNQPFELRVNGQRVLRLEPMATAIHGIAPNLLGGFGGNTITAGASGVTIAGGGKSGWLNRVSDDFGTIGGGLNNQAGDNTGDFLSAPAATVSGGSGNKASGDAATVSGGWGNTASGRQATVGGGTGNIASGDYSTVPGGSGNTAAGNYSLAGGSNASTTTAATGSFVWADASGGSYSSNNPNEFRVRATNGVRFLTSSMDGLLVDNAASASNGDGIHVDTNVSLGINYGALFARNAGTSPGIVASTGSEGTYAGVFTKMISVSGGCVGCTLIYVAQNQGSELLEVGDVTAAVGVGAPLNASDAPIIQVQRAGGTVSGGVVGVVLGKVVLSPSSQDGQTLTGAEVAAGPAAPGDYVFIVVQGLAYVKADASSGSIVAGQRLTASAGSGLSRALQTRTFEGMTILEAAPIIGIALEPLAAGQGLIPVMVTLR
jgi:trimeric autotransporter adhesin